jgi:hypothetical protein
LNNALRTQQDIILLGVLMKANSIGFITCPRRARNPAEYVGHGGQKLE